MPKRESGTQALAVGRRSRARGVRTLSKESLMVGGVAVNVSFKTSRTLSLRVKTADGPVEVSAPVGTPLPLVREFVERRLTWIEQQRARLENSTMAQAEGASKEEVQQWSTIVKALTPGLVQRWSQVMGVVPGKLAYRNMKSRWGSCQPSTGRICINVRLALYPPECLEYVVVHELCHLKEAGHGPRFHALMDHYLPDWKTRKKKLDTR